MGGGGVEFRYHCCFHHPRQRFKEGVDGGVQQAQVPPPNQWGWDATVPSALKVNPPHRYHGWGRRFVFGRSLSLALPVVVDGRLGVEVGDGSNPKGWS